MGWQRPRAPQAAVPQLRFPARTSLPEKRASSPLEIQARSDSAVTSGAQMVSPALQLVPQSALPQVTVGALGGDPPSPSAPLRGPPPLHGTHPVMQHCLCPGVSRQAALVNAPDTAVQGWECPGRWVQLPVPQPPESPLEWAQTLGSGQAPKPASLCLRLELVCAPSSHAVPCLIIAPRGRLSLSLFYFWRRKRDFRMKSLVQSPPGKWQKQDLNPEL